jgi:hypothetical protein
MISAKRFPCRSERRLCKAAFECRVSGAELESGIGATSPRKPPSLMAAKGDLNLGRWMRITIATAFQ